MVRGSAARPDLVRVALDDEPELPAAVRPRGSRRRPGRGTVLALALVLVAASGATAHEAAQVGQRLIGALALSPPLDVPLEVAWRLPASSVLGATGGLVLLSQAQGARVVALDAADGTQVWDAPQPIDPGWCAFAAEAPEPVLVCSRGLESTLATVLDPLDGSTIADRVWQGTLAALLPVDGDLVLASVDESGRVAVERWSPRTDAVVWSYRSERDLVTPVLPTTWRAGDDWIGVRSAGQLVLSLDDGAELAGDQWPAAQDSTVAVPAGDADAVAVTLRVGDGSLTRVGTDGADLWTYDAVPSGGSSPYPLLTAGGVVVCSLGSAVVALDLVDGAVLWSVQTGLSQAGSAITDGVWVAVAEQDVGGAALVARDPRTGTEQWRLSLPEGPVARLTLADGGTVVVATTDEAIALQAPVRGTRFWP